MLQIRHSFPPPCRKALKRCLWKRRTSKRLWLKRGVYQLKEDVDIAGRSIEIPAGTAATLDLNGNTITAANRGVDGIAVYGKLTLKDSKGNGRIVANKDYTGGAYGAGLIRIIGENAAMIMQGGTIYAARENATNNGQYGVAVYEAWRFHHNRR